MLSFIAYWYDNLPQHTLRVLQIRATQGSRIYIGTVYILYVRMHGGCTRPPSGGKCNDLAGIIWAIQIYSLGVPVLIGNPLTNKYSWLPGYWGLS